MFDFCTRRLGMSEGAAFRRIDAARLAKRFPMLARAIERGDVNLETLVLVRDHLAEANVYEIVAAVSQKSKREVEEIMARPAPRPDVPSSIRKLPTPSASGVNATNAGRDKLERARDPMRHRNPSGDLAVVVERAVDALLEKLEKERLGAASRPQRNVRTARAGRVSRAARREVFEGDGEPCTFVSGEGTRCPSRAFLEIDHIESRALGGLGVSANLRVGQSTVARCRLGVHCRPWQRDIRGVE